MSAGQPIVSGEHTPCSLAILYPASLTRLTSAGTSSTMNPAQEHNACQCVGSKGSDAWRTRAGGLTEVGETDEGRGRLLVAVQVAEVGVVLSAVALRVSTSGRTRRKMDVSAGLSGSSGEDRARASQVASRGGGATDVNDCDERALSA